MNGCLLRISVGMKLPIAMVGRQIIRVMGEGSRTNFDSFATSPIFMIGCQQYSRPASYAVAW
jgi:hypothetical protein